MLPEVRMARITDAIGLHRAKKLSCYEAGEMLGLSELHFRRLRDAYEADGALGIIDGRGGRASGGARRSMRSSGCWSSSRPGTSTSQPSIFTKPWCTSRWRADKRSNAATPGPRACCNHGAAHEGAEAFRASQEAGATAPVWHDAVPGRLAPRLAASRSGPRPDRDHGRRHEPHPVDLPRRGGRHGLDVPWLEGGDRAARIVLVLLHGSREPLFHDPASGRQGGPAPSDPGGAGARATRHPAYRVLFAGGGAGGWSGYGGR